MARTTLAFNSERLRQLLWERVAPPPEMLQKALRKLDEQLDAKETKFFTNQGLLVSQVDVEAHAIQQSAAIAIAKIADAMPRDRAEKAAPPSVTLEIKNGSFLLHIGGSSREEGAYVTNEIQADSMTEPTQLAPAEPQILSDTTHSGEAIDVEEPPVQVLRMSDYSDRATRKEALRLLMSDSDGQSS